MYVLPDVKVVEAEAHVGRLTHCQPQSSAACPILSRLLGG